MMKKVIRIIALVLALVTVFTFPVSAEDDSCFIDALPLGSIQGSGNYSGSVSKNGTIVFTLYTPLQVSYVDFTFRITGTAPTDMTVNGISSTIEFIKVTNDIYRCYGRLSSNSLVSQLSFKLTSTTTNYFTILNGSLAVSRYDTFETAGTLSWVKGSTWTQVSSWSAGGTGSDVLYKDTSGKPSTVVRDYAVTLTDWEGADVIEVLVKVQNYSVGSIAGFMNGSQLPIEVDPLYIFDEGGSNHLVNSSGYIYTDETFEGFLAEDGTFNGLSSTEGSYWDEGSIEDPGFVGTRIFRVRIDLRSVNRYEQAAYNPILRFGVIGSSENDCIFSIGSSRCFVDLDGIDGMTLLGLWIQDLGVTFQSGLDGLGDLIGQGFDMVQDKFDALLGIGNEGDDLSSGSEELEDDVDQIDQFEQTQQDILDSGMMEIQDAVSVASFTGALTFVQNYLNLTFMGLGDVIVVFTLPLFLGLFFYLCSRVPGATRWKSPPPKGGKKS